MNIIDFSRHFTNVCDNIEIFLIWIFNAIGNSYCELICHWDEEMELNYRFS